MSIVNKTNLLTDQEIKAIEELYNEIIRYNRSNQIKSIALNEFINNAIKDEFNPATEAWTIAVLTFLKLNNYKITKL